MRTACPVFANIAFLRIARFAERGVEEQARLKERLEERVREAIAGLPAADRIVLDAADGMALVHFGDAGPRARHRAGPVRRRRARNPSRSGLNHGPIAVTARDAGAMVFGDGIASAAAAAGFAPGGAHPRHRALREDAGGFTRPDRAAASLRPASSPTRASGCTPSTRPTRGA